MRLFLPLAPLMLALAGCAATPPETVEIDGIQTTTGVVQGVTAEGVTSYRGLQYATAERWAPPVPAYSDSPQPQMLDAFGPACPQDGQAVMVEECLYLNVWTPEGAIPGDDLPVMVWVHGGGMRAGSGNIDPAGMVRRDVIVVSFNYRLGNLGFFDYALWQEDFIRNFALLDMVTALEWVRDNIETFGGDADRVTIAGHSAGGTNVQLLMVTEEARGLFDGAIAQAGYAVTWPFRQAFNPTPEQLAVIRPVGLDNLKALPAEDIVAQTPGFTMPYVGGALLPEEPAEVFARGQQAPVPYITGGNSFDGGGVLYGAGFTAESWLDVWAPHMDRVRDLYADDFAVSDDQAAQRLFGDARYLLNARISAMEVAVSGQPAWLYFYDEPAEDAPGSPHGMEWAQVFAEEPTAMQDYWVNFIRTGEPNSAGLPEWKEQPGLRASVHWMTFDPQPVPTVMLQREKYDFLEAVWPEVRARLEATGVN